MGDFNNDGKLDMAVVNSTDNTVSILLSNGDGTFDGPSGPCLRDRLLGPTSPTYKVGHNPQAIVAVAISTTTAIWTSPWPTKTTTRFRILLGNGNGTFQTQTTFHLRFTSNSVPGPLRWRLADFDADGYLDLAVLDQTDSGCRKHVGSDGSVYVSQK